MKFDKELLIDSAKLAGQWLIDNQNVDKSDADCGRFLYCCNLKTGYYERSTSWQTGVGIIALLWLFKATDDERYIASAKLAAQYICLLQIDDPSDSAISGAFREETPQTQWSHPRDAVTAAWGLLSLYQMTKEESYLNRAIKFADWHLANAWYKGWPKATVLLGPKPDIKEHNYNLHANCQTGTAAFFMQLAKAANDEKYLRKGAIPILDYYIDIFLDATGFPCVLCNPDTKKTEREIELSELNKNGFEGFGSDWIQMHRFNDDFAALALLQGYLNTHNNLYLGRAHAYAGWVTKNQNNSGSFGNPDVEAASSTLPIFLIDLQKIVGVNLLSDAIDRAIEHLLSLQQHRGDKMVNGGMLCLDNNCNRDSNNWVNIRNTGYGIVALLKRAGFSGPAYQIA